jgi:[ribosomal protein S5]-alanine N-acetyltransferase
MPEFARILGLMHLSAGLTVAIPQACCQDTGGPRSEIVHWAQRVGLRHKTVRNTRIMSTRPPQGPGPPASLIGHNGPVEPAGRPAVPIGPSLLSARLIVRPVPWDAVRAISGGSRLDDWAADYPSDGDVIIAGLLQEVGPGVADAADQAWGHRQVVERASGLVVGGIGFFGPPREGGEVEVGYGIVPSRQGRGYATEALRAMLAMAWADPRVTAVVAGTDPGNAASQRVLEKAGFRRIAADSEFRYRLSRPRIGAPLSRRRNLGD